MYMYIKVMTLRLSDVGIYMEENEKRVGDMCANMN